MNKVIFIRHGATAGNLERRYIGRTDEPLCDLGVEQITALQGRISADCLFASPMKRTRQTAALLFPGMPDQVVADLRETDFGIFEGKTYAELSDCPAYQTWLDSNCLGPIPGGEGAADFKRRCCRAFVGLPMEGTTALVVHGGVIMAILETYGEPKKDFYSYHIPNGGAFLCDWDGEHLLNIEKLPVE